VGLSHLVGRLPALLKGFLDRIFLPGFAFKYRPNSALWDRLLTGRSAELLVTMDSPPWYYRWVQRQPGHRQMKQTILEFSGIRPVRVHSFGPVIKSSEARARSGSSAPAHWVIVQALAEALASASTHPSAHRLKPPTALPCRMAFGARRAPLRMPFGATAAVWAVHDRET